MPWSRPALQETHRARTSDPRRSPTRRLVLTEGHGGLNVHGIGHGQSVLRALLGELDGLDHDPGHGRIGRQGLFDELDGGPLESDVSRPVKLASVSPELDHDKVA